MLNETRTKTYLPILLLVLVLCFIPANATTTISYSASGTFSASTPTSTFTAPGETWAFAFQADTNPTTVLEFGNGGFNFAFSNFTYSLDGSPVAIAPPAFIRFFSQNNGGGFLICFSGTMVSNCTDALGTATSGPLMYSGMTSAPTLLPGTFPQDFAAKVSNSVYSQPDVTVTATAPEPSSLFLLGTGALGLLGPTRRKLLHHRK